MKELHQPIIITITPDIHISCNDPNTDFFGQFNQQQLKEHVFLGAQTTKNWISEPDPQKPGHYETYVNEYWLIQTRIFRITYPKEAETICI